MCPGLHVNCHVHRIYGWPNLYNFTGRDAYAVCSVPYVFAEPDLGNPALNTHTEGNEQRQSAYSPRKGATGVIIRGILRTVADVPALKQTPAAWVQFTCCCKQVLAW